jgi:ATP-dependent RNA helicase DeaD
VFEELIRQIESEQNIPAIEIAAGLAGLLQGSTPFLLPQKATAPDSNAASGAWVPGAEEAHAPEHLPESESGSRAGHKPAREHRSKRSREDGPPMESYRVEVGHAHGVLPGNIVGAIANEAGLEGRHIGHIDIRDDHSFVDLPEGMPAEIFRSLKKVRVRGVELRISRVESKPPRPERPPRGARRSGPASTSKGRRFSKDAHKPRHARKER